jgi:D-alanyl-D-alanine carboxypeptidase/D-alanyl-D-alanine-endopeptidase (penicillin-binding protein 4)
VDDTVAGQRLDRALSAITGGRLGSPGGAPGCVLVAQAGRTLYARDPTAELMPASNLKVVTADAVLAGLGDGYRFTTLVEATGRRTGSTLNGNLYLVGGGDPDLMTAAYNASFELPEPIYTSLDQLAQAVRRAGIATVSGSVIGDGARYDGQIGIPSWSPEYLAEGDVGPLSALEVDDGSPPAAGPGAAAPTGPADPTLFAAQTFKLALAAAGVKVAGPAATGSAPLGSARVAEAGSAPLGALVEQTLRVSDDTAAELLTKELGYEKAGQGTSAAGLAQVRGYGASSGLPVAQLVNLDGSGLDRGDRATCTLVSAALEQAGTTGVVAAGLPIAGRTGTLIHRMVGTVAAGRVHAKTGTLADAAALSGFVTPAAGAPTPELGEPVYFSIIINGMYSALGAPLADRIAVALAGYPDPVPLRLLGPQSPPASRP